MFRRNVSAKFSGLKMKGARNQYSSRWLDYDPEDNGDTFLQNVDLYADYTALYPRR
jgi:hypothetical protein